MTASGRAPLALDGASMRDAHLRLRANGHDAFLLSTCLRVEIAWEGTPDRAPELLACVYGDAVLPDSGVSRTDGDAFLHLCRIAAGLESPTIGEPEVLTQFRKAVLAYEGSTAGLGRVLESAVGIGRSARRRIGESGNGSLGSIAAGAASSHERVAILGAGAMARSAAAHLAGSTMTVFSRQPSQVAGHDTLPWEESIDALATDPVVISTVPGHLPLLPEASVRASLARRVGTLTLIDLGMPPGFDHLRSHPAISYLGIDEVASSVAPRLLPEVEGLVSVEAASSWVRLTASDRVGMVISAMVGHADRAVDEEVRRFAGRLTGAEDPEEVLRQLAHTVARRVLHPPISYVGSTDGGRGAVEVLGEAFGVPDA